MLRKTVLCVAILTAGTGDSVLAQASVDLVRSERYQDGVPVAPAPTPYRRVEVASGITLLNIRKLPADTHVGGWPTGLFVSAGFSWTRHLVTQVEAASQVGDDYLDYARENILVARPGGRQEYTRPLLSGQAPPTDAKTVGELPTDLPGPATTRHLIAFGQAGLKVAVTQRAHVLVDWKVARTGPPRFRLGLGVELF